jgi:hypothetical protein
MTKFIKTLLIINGIIIPIVIIILLISFISDKVRYSQMYNSNPVKVENTITKDGDTLITQGLRYDSPENIYNSTNLIIKIKPKSYKNPKILDSRSPSFEGGNAVAFRIAEPSEYFVNILFLDPRYHIIGHLLDKKASIENITIPTGDDSEKTDTTVKYIGYLIAFNDSNNDKVIDWNDKYDLFISDLNGKNLSQVTHDIDIKEFRFINRHKEIFIAFTDRQDLPDEHKITRFSVYDIKTNQLRNLTDIDKALNEVQKILNK